MLIGMVDVIFSDVAQPDQARIVVHNAGFFLKNNGWVMTLCCRNSYRRLHTKAMGPWVADCACHWRISG